MNAFKAFKACVPIEWSPNLYITLVRGMPGTRRLHRRTLEALRLRKCNRTVMRWNTPTVRGMLQQVSGKAQSEIFFFLYIFAQGSFFIFGFFSCFQVSRYQKRLKMVIFLFNIFVQVSLFLGLFGAYKYHIYR